jgi:hypothetical protein
MRSPIRKVICSAILISNALTAGYVHADSEFDVRGLKFGMKPAEVKKVLAKLGPLNDRTFIDFAYLDDNNRNTGIAAYKMCVVKEGSCAETYVVGFTEITQVSYHISRVIQGKQIAPLKALASQFAQKYGIAQLETYAFDDMPYWVLFFEQPTQGSGQLVGGQQADCGAFSYGNMSFDRTLNMPHRSLRSCPEVAGAMQFVRNGAVHDLADGVSIMATNHRLLYTSLGEKTKLRLQKQQNTRDAVKDNKLEL